MAIPAASSAVNVPTPATSPVVAGTGTKSAWLAPSVDPDRHHCRGMDERRTGVGLTKASGSQTEQDLRRLAGDEQQDNKGDGVGCRDREAENAEEVC